MISSLAVAAFLSLGSSGAQLGEQVQRVESFGSIQEYLEDPGRPLPPDANSTSLAQLSSGATPGALHVGVYVLSITDINLRENSFTSEFYVSTRWDQRGGENPSDHLRVLNGISNSDIGRFDLVSSTTADEVEWRLYLVRSAIFYAWVLPDYPFDKQLLSIRLGLGDPLQRHVALISDRESSYVHPELVLYDWQIGALDILESHQSVVGTLAIPELSAAVLFLPTVDVLIRMQRRGHLEIVPSFLGYFLAIGLCVLALAIKGNRNDLVLAGVVAAAGNSIYLAQLLPVSALSGFSGQIQVIVYVGVVYTAIADELIDHLSSSDQNVTSWVFQSALLPVYLAATLLSIWLALPSRGA